MRWILAKMRLAMDAANFDRPLYDEETVTQIIAKTYPVSLNHVAAFRHYSVLILIGETTICVTFSFIGKELPLSILL